jgi:2'-5' RNA ligase
MPSKQPLSFMFKPLASDARAFVACRRNLKIGESYGCDRLHTTALPLGDGRDVSDAQIDLLDQIVRTLDIQPFKLEFDRLCGNMLMARRGATQVREFRQRASRLLAARGMTVPVYRSPPHLSLAYDKPPNRTVRVPPIGYPVDRLLLIRSIYGEGRHETLCEWELIARQYAFDF